MEPQTINTRPFITEPAAYLCHYQLIACPDAAVRAQVLSEKQYLHTRFAATDPIAGNGAIVVALFMAKEEMEATLIRWMHRIISAQKSFMVTLQGFNGLAGSCIYLRVQQQQPFLQLAKELQVVNQYVKSYGCPEMKLVTNPCLPLTGPLETTMHQRIANDCTQRGFQASFEVRELILMRKQHALDTGRQVNVFGLQPA